MSSVFSEYVRTAFAPPQYLAPPFSGIDLSASGVKAVRLETGAHGLTLASFSEVRLPPGAFVDGDIVDHAVIVGALSTAAHATNIHAANAALPESKSYLFDAVVQGEGKHEWRTAVEQRLEELVPLPSPETAFDIARVGSGEHGSVFVAGIGFAKRIVDDTLSVFDGARVTVQALEGETFAIARALLPAEDDSTTLIIDVGKTTTKISIVKERIPRFAATIGIGGHALTLVVQKYFGVTEEEARKVKTERGIVSEPGNEEYLAAMLSTVSAIRDEISLRLDYWQGKAVPGGTREKVSKAILVGGNASVRGLPQYLERALRIPVVLGDVFTNFASRDTWIPALGYTESLAYATAIGLALRSHAELHA